LFNQGDNASIALVVLTTPSCLDPSSMVMEMCVLLLWTWHLGVCLGGQRGWFPRGAWCWFPLELRESNINKRTSGRVIHMTFVNVYIFSTYIKCFKYTCKNRCNYSRRWSN
jgi:hypothetical protein